MPRLGLGMPIISDTARNSYLVINDFVFLNDVTGELTPDLTAVRKNLLLQSQTFKTTWATNNAVIPNDLYEAPDNSLTAQAITASSAGASSVLLQQTVATTSGETYTYSLHAKKAANGFVSIQFGDGTTTRKAWFNLSTGAVSDTSNILTSSFDKMDDDWFRVSITFQANATTSSSFVRIFAASVAGSTATGVSFQAGTELLYIWGAQLEEDSRLSNYMVTTNTAVTVAASFSEFSKVFNYELDGDGVQTGNITIEESPITEGAFERTTENLVLNGDYEELGSELVTNGDFATDTNWTKGTGWTISGGSANCDGTQTGNSGIVQQNGVAGVSLDLQVGKQYKIIIDVTVSAGFITYIEVSGNNYHDDITTTGIKTLYLSPTSTNDRISIVAGSTFVGSVNSVSVEQVDPNNRWVLGTGWSISDGKAVATSCTNENLVGALSILIGNAYEVTFTVSDYSGSGTVKPMLGTVGAVSGTTVNADGTYTQILVADANQSAIAFRAGGTAFTGKIDNVTVKEYAITPSSARIA